jgi:AcrR family transcriptional regulator
MPATSSRPRRRPTSATSDGDARQRLLDAAERLLAAHGSAGTGLRAITTAAGVNLAAVTYHFGGKEALIEAVLRRRFEPVHAERSALLRQLLERPTPPGPADLAAAIVRPAVGLCRTAADHPAVAVLVARILFTETERFAALLRGPCAEGMELLSHALTRALPHLAADEALWRLHAAFGAMANGMLLLQQRLGLVGEHPAPDPDTAGAAIEAFVAAGLAAPPTRPPTVPSHVRSPRPALRRSR